MKEAFNKILDKIAKKNGYIDRDSLLMDYQFIPTVMIPNHKKIEILKLFMISLINK